MGFDPYALIARQRAEAAKAAEEAAKKLAKGGHLGIISDPFRKPPFVFKDGYGKLSTICPTSHLMRTCYSEFSRYPKQIEILRNMMESKRNGALKVLNIGVAQGQEPLTHISTAFELSKGSQKTISNFLDLKTVDIQVFAPELPYEARSLDPAVIRHLEHIYDPRSGKSMWGTPIEEAVGKMLQSGEKQDVILFNNVIQHMAPENESTLPSVFEQLADLVAAKGIICAEMESTRMKESIPAERFNLLRKILQQKGFSEIGEGIFQKG